MYLSLNFISPILIPLLLVCFTTTDEGCAPFLHQRTLVNADKHITPKHAQELYGIPGIIVLAIVA